MSGLDIFWGYIAPFIALFILLFFMFAPFFAMMHIFDLISRENESEESE